LNPSRLIPTPAWGADAACGGRLAITPAKSENANRAEKRDHRREVTDLIIKMLEDSVAPWQKPWEGVSNAVQSNNREVVPWR
jgi:antirestriction factor ArdC-like protein